MGSFRPNAFGVIRHRGQRDRVGRGLLERYRIRGTPNDGSSWTNGDCSLRVLRGASFADKAQLRALLGAFSLRRGRSILRKRLSGGARPGLTGGAPVWKDKLFWVVGRGEQARGRHGQASQVPHIRDLSGVGACDLLVSLWAAEPRRHRLCPRKAERGRRPRRRCGHSVYRRGAAPSGCPVARVARVVCTICCTIRDGEGRATASRRQGLRAGRRGGLEWRDPRTRKL